MARVNIKESQADRVARVKRSREKAYRTRFDDLDIVLGMMPMGPGAGPAAGSRIGDVVRTYHGPGFGGSMAKSFAYGESEADVAAKIARITSEVGKSIHPVIKKIMGQ